jgi:hypothetical protein
MVLTEELAFALAIGVACVCGAATGRIFALEAEDRRTAILAAAYCGAGAGILSAPLFGFALVLIAEAWHRQSITSALARAAEATGPALLWGAAGGAAGGLVVGILVALFKRCVPR